MVGGPPSRPRAAAPRSPAFQRGATSNATTTYSYVWRDGPLTSAVTLTNTDGTTQSLYAYDEAGRLLGVTLTGGVRPRTVAVTTDLGGQILTRDEQPQYAGAPAANPREKRYIFDGVVMGEVGNDGTDNTTFAAAVAEGRAPEPQSTTASPAGPFRNGGFSGAAHADFDQNYDAVNYRSVATTTQSYTVRAGDTLAGIAQTLWGDANLWYLIAGANGLSADETLAEGRVLSIPSTVVNRGNTADTWRPYDPAEALGDVQPNTPVPQPRAAQGGRRRNRCGVFGAILLAVVAIAVTVVTAGATAALGPVLSGVVSGAAGSIASQAVGVATGIQDRFSFKNVALAAIGGGVAGGLSNAIPGAIGGSKALGAAVRGAAGSAITQGVAVATGLQRRFDWAGVAAAGVGAGVSTAVGTALRVDPLSQSADNISRTLVAGTAGAIANAVTRSIAQGTSFGDNILSALPDVIASTVGSVVQAGIFRAQQARRNTVVDPETGKRITLDEPTRQLIRQARRGAAFDDEIRSSGRGSAGPGGRLDRSRRDRRPE
ncbi:LysM peptidoglycan-binding domain-containing protein [Sphingomonas sanguinis]|uniref:LysM peptidoglycan-binding domain-containing protein n=1 Tax=Sphingomonas sanguinis TaxID=33051 RepID=UPI001C57C200|nr:LysM domain-containing protein [Sphingomonas sanguinis]QXT34430.1 LysM peptidoglycan-binding domain-containing protein [Sphingomonas sanguinis]